MSDRPFHIALLPGDGIGPEVIEPSTKILDLAIDRAGARPLEYHSLEAGAAHYKRAGESLPTAAMDRARSCDAIFLGAMGLPSIRYPDGTEIAPQLELRETLDLYAGVRPIRSVPGLSRALTDERSGDLDFVLVRESTEGLFKSRGNCEMVGDDVARDTLEITRSACERLFHHAFRLARRRKAEGYPGHVTCVDKANVLGAFAFFRKVFDEVRSEYPDIEASHGYIDAIGLMMVKRPWDFDVLVTENMFGDILSDIGAGLIGGMGMAPSADIGDEHAVFQPCHGSAPDIAGRGLANPVATILSGAMMLEWLGARADYPEFIAAGKLVVRAVDEAFRTGTLIPGELGGDAGTNAIATAIGKSLASLDVS